MVADSTDSVNSVFIALSLGQESVFIDHMAAKHIVRCSLRVSLRWEWWSDCL